MQFRGSSDQRCCYPATQQILGHEVHCSRRNNKIDIACFRNSDIEAIVLPSTIKEIGWGAFSYCENLKSANFPDGLENIAGSAFVQTALEKIVVLGSVKKLGNWVFGNCEN